MERIRRAIAEQRLEHALALADYAVRRWPHDAQVLLASARLAKRANRTLAALRLLRAAEAVGCDAAAPERRLLVEQCAPYWHFRMMNDEARNQAYDLALRHHVTPDTVVLDIGCGAGLLSMMAARAGAKHVYACDVSELMAHQARQIIAANGYAERVTVINGLSHQLVLGRDLPGRVDLVVAEVFDTGLLGESAMATFAHARTHLLAPHGQLLPPRATVRAVLLESDRLHREVITTRCCGFDVHSLNVLSPPYFQARLDAFPHRLLSSPQAAARYDFSRTVEPQIPSVVTFRAARDGTCHGVAFWFSLDFGHDDNELSTGPESPWNCWSQAVSAFEIPVQVRAGDEVSVRLTHSDHQMIQFAKAPHTR
ncbi:MAG: class I SAM-dependent methyltransferase [Pseudomonadota bacterium]